MRSTNPVTEEQKRHLAELVNRCVVFAERNGQITRLCAGRFPYAISMKFQYHNIIIEFDVLEMRYPHGSYSIKVKEKKRVVFKAHGKLMNVASGIKVKKYTTGDWEKSVPATAFAAAMPSTKEK